MISFEILGEVTAREGAWKARLTPRQQRLLAALVLGEGASVSRERLEEILWDSHAPYDPEKAVNQVACEVRGQLRLASPDGGDPVPSSQGGYRLALAPEQADVLRFRDKADEARHSDGPDSAEIMRQALREWGPDVSGLHGGDPLRGLRGRWADSTRYLLRSHYRDAVIHCLSHDMGYHRYKPVLMECEQRAGGEREALLDEEFVRLWMLAAAGAGDRARAHTVFKRAADAAARSGHQLGSFLPQLDADLRAGHVPPGMMTAVRPPEVVLLSARPRQGDEVNYEVSVVNERDPGDDAGAGSATGQRAVPGNPALTAHSVIEADRISDGAVATGISADPGPGAYESKARIGSIEGQFTGVDLRKRS